MYSGGSRENSEIVVESGRTCLNVGERILGNERALPNSMYDIPLKSLRLGALKLNELVSRMHLALAVIR